MIVGCYALDLYCRNQTGEYDDTHKIGCDWKAYPAQFTGPTEQDCKRQARRNGWIFNKDRDVTCSLCSNKVDNSKKKP